MKKIFYKLKDGIIIWIGFSLTTLVIWITYAAVSTVTTGQTLTADMWNNMAWNYDYSTNEVDTGKKWIDWKPIYRKVIHETNIPAATTNYSHGIANIDKIVDTHYIMEQGTSWFYDNSIWYQGRRVGFTTSTIQVISNITADNAWFIMEYTKTTD